MRLPILITCITTLAATLTCSHGKSENLVLNGSFELPGGSATYQPGNSFEGWIVGDNDEVSIGRNPDDIFVSSRHAFAGSHYLNVQGIGSVQQNISTIPGVPHTLAFAIGGFPSPPSFGDPTSVKSIVVEFANTTYTTSRNTFGASGNQFQWDYVTLEIPGNEITETITPLIFRGISPEINIGGATVDAVSVIANVPEPNGLAFVALACGAISCFSNRPRYI